MKRIRWTEKEDSRLIELVWEQRYIVRQIAVRFPQRSEKAVRERIYVLQLDTGREGNHWRWKEEEIQKLCGLIGRDSLAGIHRKHFPYRSYNEILRAAKRFMVQN